MELDNPIKLSIGNLKLNTIKNKEMGSWKNKYKVSKLSKLYHQTSSTTHN